MPTALIPPPPRPVLKRKPAESLPVGFLSKAAGLPGGRTLAVALALCIEAASARCRTITFGSWLRTRYAISDDAALDALNRLSAAGLISAKRGRGRFATVTLHLDDEAPLAAA